MNNLRAVVFLSLLALLTVSGCEKTNDLPRMQEEALAIQTSYGERFNELKQRVQTVFQRYSALPPALPDAGLAQRSLLRVRAAIERVAVTLRQIPGRAQTGVKSGNADAVEAMLSALHGELEQTVRETVTELQAAESWVAIAEQRKPAGAAAPPPGAPSNDPAAPGR